MALTQKPKKPIKETFAGHCLSALNVQHCPDHPHERIGHEGFAQETVEMRRNFLQLGHFIRERCYGNDWHAPDGKLIQSTAKLFAHCVNRSPFEKENAPFSLNADPPTRPPRVSPPPYAGNEASTLSRGVTSCLPRSFRWVIRSTK
jgi:hypothetical protein